MEETYDRDSVVGVLGGKPIPKKAIGNEDKVSYDIAIFLLFINALNEGQIA